VENVAYDFLEWAPALEELARSCRAVCFGTLAQRNADSCQTIRRLLRLVRERNGGEASGVEPLAVFDVDLRQQFYTAQTIEDSFYLCDWLKLNADELATICRLFGINARSESVALEKLSFPHPWQIALMCLTRGENGCLIHPLYGAELDHAGVR